MAYFRCSTGSTSSGDSVALIVQCDADFAGSTITADNGEDVFTETCPSVSPYTVRFEGIPTGTYTISGIAEGQTFTTQFTVLDYETTLNAAPEGATVLPINDIQIWLHCAGIYDKTYTTIGEVLADNTTLLALISDNNAADYMARSTTWANAVVANQTAMGYIGNNDYCADKLLNDSTWSTAICNSEYFESVLNVKVPTMTSNTTPSGECFGSAIWNNNATYTYFKSFDNNSATQWAPREYPTTTDYVAYDFGSQILLKKVAILVNSIGRCISTAIEGSNDKNSWATIDTIDTSTQNGVAQGTTTPTIYNLVDNATKYRYIRIRYANVTSFGTYPILQFYGRA